MKSLNSASTNLTDDKDFIKWNPSFALGIPGVDNQHIHLVELCNKLYTGIMESRKKNGNNDNANWQAALAGSLKECVNYVAIHFSYEEGLMKMAGYPEYANHKKRHDEFTRKVLETAQNFNTMDFSDAVKFCKFLYDWILSHIAHEDKLFVKSVIEYSQKNESK